MDWESLKLRVLNIFDQMHKAETEYFQLWSREVVFSPRWFVALALLVLPWAFWFVVRKRGSEGRLLCAGGAVASLSMLMDQVGVTLHLWTYPTTVSPMMPSFLPFDLSALPIATMLWLQFFPKMKLVWKALVYTAAGTAFDFACDVIGLSAQEGWGWSRAYTFLILILLYLLAYWVANRLKYEPIAGGSKE